MNYVTLPNGSRMVVDPMQPHLGGYVEGGDEATQFPELWDWLVRVFEVGSVLDVGCGDGQALRHFRERGCRVLGIDGCPQDDPDILRHDFTEGPVSSLLNPSARKLWHGEGFDLVWCCEFVEHVEEAYLPNFLEAFRFGRRVLLTHAEPGQTGHHHVNCRNDGYWIGVMAAAGFAYDPDLTTLSRLLAGANRSPWNHFERSGLAFRRLDV